MNPKFFITFVICLISFSSIAVSKITDPRARAEFYDGCIKQYVASSNFSKREFSKYCSCTADSVMEKFTSKEIIVLGLDMMSLNKDDQTKAILANRKMKNIIAECMSRIIR